MGYPCWSKNDDSGRTDGLLRGSRLLLGRFGKTTALSSAALVFLLVAQSPPPPRSRIECEFSRYGKVDRDDRYHLGELLESCKNIQCQAQGLISSDPNLTYTGDKLSSIEVPLDAITLREGRECQWKSASNYADIGASNIKPTVLNLPF